LGCDFAFPENRLTLKVPTVIQDEIKAVSSLDFPFKYKHLNVTVFFHLSNNKGCGG
jgi:hypothetical protein